MDDITTIIHQAQSDVNVAITLGAAVYYGYIDVDADDLLEVYYRLWKWKKRLAEKCPENLTLLLKNYDEAFKNHKKDVELFFQSKEKTERLVSSTADKMIKTHEDASTPPESKQAQPNAAKPQEPHRSEPQGFYLVFDNRLPPS